MKRILKLVAVGVFAGSLVGAVNFKAPAHACTFGATHVPATCR